MRSPAHIGTTPLFLALLGLAAIAHPYFQPPAAHAWGSVTGQAETHQVINARAMKLLEADPAFVSSSVSEFNIRGNFPTLSTIALWEGVSQVRQEGEGPDNSKNAPYSAHYYNPTLAARKLYGGGAPQHVKMHGSRLVVEQLNRGQGGGQNNTLFGKSAAYGSHFTADMLVPYHVIGMGREALLNLVETYTLKDIINHLTTDDYGTEALRVNVLNQRHSFMTEEVRRFKETTDDDWWAPFYYNGSGAVGTGIYMPDSSHIWWEWQVNPAHNSIANATITGPSKHWKNASGAYFASSKDVGDFMNRPWDTQSQQAEAMTKALAQETHSNLHTFGTSSNYIATQYIESVKAVYTFWRSTFSAMQPTINETLKQDGTMLSALVKSNAAERPNNVWIRMTGQGCILNGDPIQPAPGQWLLPVNPTGQSCTIKIEAAGAFASTPDLQYASMSKTITPAAGREYTAQRRTAPGSRAQQGLPGVVSPITPPGVPSPISPPTTPSVDPKENLRRALDIFLRK